MSLQAYTEIDVVKIRRSDMRCVAIQRMSWKEWKEAKPKAYRQWQYWYRAYEAGTHGYSLS